MQVLDFSTELLNAEVSFTLRKSDSATDALPPILKFFRKSKKKTCGGISFIGGWIGQPDFFKRKAIKDIFYFHNCNFSNVFSKMCEEIILEAFS